MNFYKEGMFWKAYNYSAFNFSYLVKEYTLKRRYIKELGDFVVSIGFPDAVMKESVERVRKLAGRVEVTDVTVEIELVVGERLNEMRRMPVTGWSEEVFRSWFNAVAEESRERPAGVVKIVPDVNEGEMMSVLKELRDYPILQKSPLEVQMFVIELQNRLKK